jgi:hypothetical protein
VIRSRFPAPILSFLFLGVLGASGTAHAENYRFDSTISKEVLENYLARSLTFTEMLTDDADSDVPARGSSFAEHLRFVQNTGAKFIGRAVYRWANADRLSIVLQQSAPRIAQLHALDSDIVIQAAIFEMVNAKANNIAIPAWVFEEFGLPVQARNFSYDSLIFKSGKYVNNFGNGSSVPDISRLESKMWFFYFAASYIDAGIEALHIGQVELMDDNDLNHNHWAEVFLRIRKYAREKARRHMVLLDAHVPNHTFTRGPQSPQRDTLLLDFHTFPLRVRQVTGSPTQGVLAVNYSDGIYRRSGGGVTPSGWRCDHLPYLVEFDNFGSNGTPGQPSPDPFVWGWDEISWYANQNDSTRTAWLYYAVNWLKENDSIGHLQMPAGRLAVGFTGRWYWGHTRSAATANGMNAEETIKAIWLSRTTSLRARRGMPPHPAARATGRISPQVMFGSPGRPWSDALGRFVAPLRPR